MTTSREDFVKNVTTMALSVYDFHERFDVEQISPDDDNEASEEIHSAMIQAGLFRLNLMMEELGEVASAVNRSEVINMLEEMADVLYVAMGSMLRFGDSGREAVTAVVNKNDLKGYDSYREDPRTGKLVKIGTPKLN